MSELKLNVITVYDNKLVSVPYTIDKTTAEDVCIHICKHLCIGTLARHLFGLRVAGKHYFLMPSATFNEKPGNLEFRVRFKPASIKNLLKIDPKCYDYYFHQARQDVHENKIPEITFDKFRRELVGLGVTDMYRVMLEKDIPRETVEREYKNYIPKEVLRKHQFFIKKPIHETLGHLQKYLFEASYVKAEYLRQLDIIAPDYLTEVYKAVVDEEGSVCNINVKLSPYHPTEPGLKYSYESKKDQWHLICTVEELGFVSIRNDGTIELARKNGIPFYVKFSSNSHMHSFISLLDGYYRLTCKWIYNLCKDVVTPSLKKLCAMRCHGPVGGEFSYEKLEEKRNNKPGCFIIRESEFKYNSYFIDVCAKDSLKPKTYRLERIKDDEFIFNDDLTKYKTIHQLMAAYNDPNEPIFLQECLPPTEYDISPLLLCQSENLIRDSLTDSSALSVPSPLCISWKDLQVYKGQKKEGLRGITMVYRSMWKVSKGKKIEVAMKVLKQENSERFLKEFLSLAGQWAFLQSSAIVRIYGITLTSNISLVLEYFRLGPLDHYLKENRNRIKPEDLIEAASNLACALWHLKENDIVHGNIRCRKLMVHTHDEKSFKIKLTDPGIHNSYPPSEVHWIPVECYTNLDFAKKSAAADVWAFATTLWEIYMFGEELRLQDHVKSRHFYASGKRLPRPQGCPSEIYELMKECWDADPHRRKQPQAINRDINQILYQVYNSRKTHSYAKVFNKNMNSVAGISSQSLDSNATEVTTLGQDGDLISATDICSVASCSSVCDKPAQTWSTDSDDGFTYDMSNFMSNLNTLSTSLDSLCSMQSIFELERDSHVVLQGRIGQGFYGEVFKGTLEFFMDTDREPRRVAVKKLKSSDVSSSLQDFEREINIMKSLKHPNIVEILGVSRDPEISLVMEYVPHGSLQSYLKIYKDSLSTYQRLKYALDIAKGMQYLGKKNIVHRDLATRNILVVDENNVKISDFGLAQVIGTNDYYILKTNRELPIKWYALESLRDGKFSVRSDVWSYGVTLCEMFNNGEEPNLAIMTDGDVPEQQLLLHALEQGTRLPCPPNCDQVIYIRIIHPCWAAVPQDRPLFSQIVLETEDLLAQYK